MASTVLKRCCRRVFPSSLRPNSPCSPRWQSCSCIIYTISFLTLAGLNLMRSSSWGQGRVCSAAGLCRRVPSSSQSRPSSAATFSIRSLYQNIVQKCAKKFSFHGLRHLSPSPVEGLPAARPERIQCLATIPSARRLFFTLTRMRRVVLI